MGAGECPLDWDCQHKSSRAEPGLISREERQPGVFCTTRRFASMSHDNCHLASIGWPSAAPTLHEVLQHDRYHSFIEMLATLHQAGLLFGDFAFPQCTAQGLCAPMQHDRCFASWRCQWLWYASLCPSSSADKHGRAGSGYG